MRKTLKFQLVALWSVALILINSVTAYAAYSTLNVTLVRQAKSNWCWAASLEMSASYLGYSDYDQWDIVKEVKGTASTPYPNLAGGASDYKAGMEFATDDDYTATRTSGTLTITQLNNYMTNHVPVIIAIGTYNSSGSRTSGHAVVVYAVDKTNSRFQVRNPASDYPTTYDYSVITDTTATSHWDATVKIS